ncbi:MAG: hypothetical protein LH630_06600 [Actinomycetia bacterium]|nr:hypothetical protein [Actinomycetes bacterium]
MPMSTRVLRPPVHLLLLAVLATLIPLAMTSSADAAPPKPNTPNFGKAIESYAPYEENTVCDVVNKPGAEKIAGLIRSTYGSDEAIGIARNACYTTSEHNDGRALDWMVDATTKAGKAKADAFLSWLLATDGNGNRHAMARRLGIMYIIFNKRIWRAYGDRGWDSYSGVNPHTDHIHISLSYDGSTGRTSFWNGKPLGTPCVNGSLTTSARRVQTDPMRYVPVAPTRLASTESGAGMLSGPCRLFQSSGRRVDVQVTGTGPVPGRGVAAVALNVAMRRPNWNAGLTAGPAGGEIPPVRRVSAGQNQISSASMQLPVGADGKVSFFTDFGATDLAVSVVGYYVDPDAPLSLRRKIAADGGDQFDGVAPQRIASLSFGPNGTSRVTVAGRAGTDPASSSAVLSLTVTAGNGRGSLYAYPAGGNRPRIPVLTYGRGATTVQTSVPVGRNAGVVIENQGSNGRDITLDIAGAYEPATLNGGRGLALRATPKTVVDTGSDLQLSFLGDGSTKDFAVGDAVARDADSVLLQVTARRATTAGRLTFWRPGGSRPGTTDLSITPGQTVTGTVVAGLGDERKVRVLNSGAKGVDVRITVLGSFR